MNFAFFFDVCVVRKSGILGPSCVECGFFFFPSVPASTEVFALQLPLVWCSKPCSSILSIHLFLGCAAATVFIRTVRCFNHRAGKAFIFEVVTRLRFILQTFP